MHRESETAINPTAIILFIFAGISSANLLHDPPKHNPLNIDWYPAPSPEDGPAASANAERDPALIPATAGAIVGAYVFFTCIVAVTLFIIKRHLRSQAQIAAAGTLDVEMQTPAFYIKNNQFGQFSPSPISPGGGPRNFSWPSPENDTKNPYVFPSSARSPITPPGTDPYVDTRIVQADREIMERDLEDIYAHVMEQEEAKKAGVDVKELPTPVLQKSPLPMASPQRNRRPSNLDFNDPPKTKSRASSIISALISPRKKSMKPMQISSPMLSPMSASFPRREDSDDQEPLAPRHYHPPPPPPVPSDQEPYQYSRNQTNGISPTRTIDEQLNAVSLNPFTQHRTQPSTNSIQSSRGDPMSATSTTSQTPLFPAPKMEKPTPKPIVTSNNNASRALPFRAFEPAITSPSFVPSTKTTVLERSGNSHHGPNTAGLKTPWSAGAVPYSPYQPFSPLMPMTPHLVTKEERKAKKKAEGRRPVMEMVKNPHDVWDSGY